MAWMALLTLAAGVARADYAEDVRLLRRHHQVIELTPATGSAKVAVVPDFQGRVMTSTASGDKGNGFGWINKKAVAENKRQPHINVFGGEDRFWLGPEGGQFSLFFPKGKPFKFDFWQTPEAIDWGAWKTVRRSNSRAAFARDFTLTNYAGTKLSIRANREVRLLTPLQIKAMVGRVGLSSSMRVVAYETDNRITNIGRAAWTKKSGMPSIWILGMFNPSPQTTAVIPFKPGPESQWGRIVNDAYFGKVPADRLKVDAKKGVLFFKADGKRRSKIGVPPLRATNVAGSWNAQSRTLTLVEFTLPKGARDYVNSMWEMQKNPFGGDVVNSYNDGPLEGGGQMGPFYELESSSPAAALKPGQTLRHVHRTLHLQGDAKLMDAIARRKLRVGLKEIEGALK